MKTSFIIAVLESYDVVKRQLLFLSNVLPKYNDEFEKEPSIENFFRLSKQFIINTGLASVYALAAMKA